jgi:glutamyl-tRNA reductase
VSWRENIFGDLKGRTVLLLGAGKMSETTARHLWPHRRELGSGRQPDL